MTGQDIFDVWSLFHFAFWVFFGHLAWMISRAKFHFGIWTAWASLSLALAFVWEIVENYILAPKYPEIWIHPESLMNSMVGDIITCIVGVGLTYAVLYNHHKKNQ